jgi:hypothetical protein
MLLCANLKCTKGENGGRKQFDPQHRPGKATTCSPECTKELEVEKRKGRWKRVGPAQNALSRERHRPIITQMPLGTLVRTRWSRPPNMKHCPFRLDNGELCGKEFDSRKGATHCPEHRGKIRKQAYLKQYYSDNVEVLSAQGKKARWAEQKQDRPPIMKECQNPNCPYGEDGRPKQFERRMGKNEYCSKECRMAVWLASQREKTDPGRRFTPEHRPKISAALKRAKAKA